MENAIFTVNDEPYCIWERDLAAQNKEFLTGLDPGYFEYLLKIHMAAEDEKWAALSLRAALHHALETLFTLLAAYVQAPGCVYAWIPRCNNTTLRGILERIEQKDDSLPRALNIPAIGWGPIADSVFTCSSPNLERNKRTAELFATLWARLAAQFTSSDHIDEYNAIKHGLRIRNSGFSLQIGTEHEYGVPPPQSEMRPLGGSKFGSAFYHVRPANSQKGNRSLVSERISLNWSVERVVQQLQLVGLSLTNVISALKIANGVPGPECKFERPSDEEVFQRPWTHSVGVTRFATEPLFADQLPVLSREQLLEELRNNKRSGDQT